MHSCVGTGVHTSMCVYCVYMHALYVCKQCVHAMCLSTVSILCSVGVHLLKYTVNIPMSICTCVRVCTLSLCVCPFHFMCG